MTALDPLERLLNWTKSSTRTAHDLNKNNQHVVHVGPKSFLIKVITKRHVNHFSTYFAGLKVPATGFNRLKIVSGVQNCIFEIEDFENTILSYSKKNRKKISHKSPNNAVFYTLVKSFYVLYVNL